MTTGLSGPLVSMWTASMKGEDQSPATIQRRTGTLRRFTAWLGRDARTATPDDISGFLASGHWARATKSAYYDDLHAWWAWMVRTERLDLDPTARVNRPRRPRGIPRPVETDDLLRALDHATGDTRAMILLGAYQALRRTEIAAVRGEDVAARVLYVCGKGSVPAAIPLHDLVAKEAERRPRRGFWFPGRVDAGRLGGHAIAEHIGEAFGAVGVPGVTPHMLRHWCATTMLRAGATLREVQEFLRHASISSTEGYTRVMFDDLAVALRRLPVAAPVLTVPACQ